MKKYRPINIYTIDELISNDFDEKEFNELIDTPSLIWSVVISMFRFIKISDSKISDDDIIQLIKTDNWQDNYYWNWKQHDLFLNKLFLAFKNIYRHNNYNCYINASEFLMKYGFIVKDSNQNFNKHCKNILNYA